MSECVCWIYIHDAMHLLAGISWEVASVCLLPPLLLKALHQPFQSLSFLFISFRPSSNPKNQPQPNNQPVCFLQSLHPPNIIMSSHSTNHLFLSLPPSSSSFSTHSQPKQYLPAGQSVFFVLFLFCLLINLIFHNNTNRFLLFSLLQWHGYLISRSLQFYLFRILFFFFCNLIPICFRCLHA